MKAKLKAGLMPGSKWILVIILFIGSLLRIYQLGLQSFWFDEAGVAVAAVSPTLSDAIEVGRSHTAAMPLDYIAAWLMARFSLDEGWLRLPSAIWGILTLLVAYKLFTNVVSERAALIGVLFLTISPGLIYYSRELRFYAALCFFYLLLTWLIIKAFRQNNTLSWIFTGAVGIVGFYFHIYVVFAFVNGILIWWFVFRQKDKRYLLVRNLAFTIGCVFLVCLPGYLFFAMEPFLDYQVKWNQIASQLLIGLGWFPYYFSSAGVVFSVSCGLLTMVSWRKAILMKNDLLAALAASVIIQAVVITLIDIGTGYFIASRQFIILTPLNLLFLGWFIAELWDRKNALFSARKKALVPVDYAKVNRAAALLLFLILFSSGLLTDISDQNQPKSEGRRISQILHDEWVSKSPIFVIPWNEPLLYQYYLKYRLNDVRLEAYFSGINWEDISSLENQNSPSYLITPPLRSTEDMNVLVNMRFSPYPGFNWDADSPQILWVKN
jgi:uncharacterized membrane protein